MELHLPFLGVTAVVREMTGVEEDVLMDRKKLEDGRAFNHILTNCTTSIAFADGVPRKPTYEEVVALKMADRLALLLAIRMETFGPLLSDTMKCADPTCRTNINVSLTLDAVTDYPKRREDFTPEGHYTVVIDDLTVTCKLIDGNSERFIANAQPDERMTMALMTAVYRVTAANGAVMNDNDKKRWLKALGMAKRMKLRDAIEENQLGPDTRFHAVCPKCDMNNVSSLENLYGFFFPGVSKKMEAM